MSLRSVTSLRWTLRCTYDPTICGTTSKFLILRVRVDMCTRLRVLCLSQSAKTGHLGTVLDTRWKTCFGLQIAYIYSSRMCVCVCIDAVYECVYIYIVVAIIIYSERKIKLAENWRTRSWTTAAFQQFFFLCFLILPVLFFVYTFSFLVDNDLRRLRKPRIQIARVLLISDLLVEQIIEE